MSAQHDTTSAEAAWATLDIPTVPEPSGIEQLADAVNRFYEARRIARVIQRNRCLMAQTDKRIGFDPTLDAHWIALGKRHERKALDKKLVAKLVEVCGG